MAETYGMLPSQVAEHATTYDVMVMDVLASYDEHERQKQNGGTDIYKTVSQEDLDKIVENNQKRHESTFKKT